MSNPNDGLLKELGISTSPDAFEDVSAEKLAKEQQRLDVELKKLELADRIETMASKKRKIEARKEQLNAQLKSLFDELARRAARQRGCSHKKGGTTRAGQRDPLPPEGGDADVYALIKFQLPTGDWMVICQRCGAEWFPADPWTGKPETVIGGISHSEILMYKTDNTAGGASQFKFEDNRTPAEVERDRWKPPRDENGNEVPDIRALPPNAGRALHPPPAVRATR